MIAQARRRVAAARPGVDFVHDDLLTAVSSTFLEPGTFDFVCSVTAIHHMDFDRALRVMADLVAPGGKLFVVGLAATRGPGELAFAAMQMPVARAVRLAHGGKGAPDGMPVVWPTVSHGEVRRATSRCCPTRGGGAPCSTGTRSSGVRGGSEADVSGEESLLARRASGLAGASRLGGPAGSTRADLRLWPPPP